MVHVKASDLGWKVSFIVSYYCAIVLYYVTIPYAQMHITSRSFGGASILVSPPLQILEDLCPPPRGIDAHGQNIWIFRFLQVRLNSGHFWGIRCITLDTMTEKKPLKILLETKGPVWRQQELVILTLSYVM